jgi:hypothetical protein
MSVGQITSYTVKNGFGFCPIYIARKWHGISETGNSYSFSAGRPKNGTLEPKSGTTSEYRHFQLPYFRLLAGKREMLRDPYSSPLPPD